MKKLSLLNFYWIWHIKYYTYDICLFLIIYKKLGMNNCENDEYSKWLWATKRITGPDEFWFICKFFKTKKLMPPLDEQRRILEKKKQYFWEYIPETILCETQDGGYFIRQKFIKWKTLSSTNVSDLPVETIFKIIDLIKKYLKFHREQWWIMDLVWYQHYKSEPRVLERKFRNFLKIYRNFLSSTNIMVSDDWNVYMVDVCESTEVRLQWRIKNFCAKPFIRMTIHNLEKLLQSKIQAEKEKTSNELTNALK